MSALVLVGTWLMWRHDPAAHRQSAAPESFSRRVLLKRCGTVHPGPRIDIVPAAELDCMREARATGTGAELVVVTSTTEGDPVTTYYRVFDARRDVEIFVDYSGDRFSQFGWAHYWCPVAGTMLTTDPIECARTVPKS